MDKIQNGIVTPTTPTELDKQVADVMEDIDKDIDEDVTEADENDPELLAELAQITGEPRQSAAPTQDTGSSAIVLPTTLLNKVDLLKSRLEMYESAEKAASEAGESGRARRFNRGIQTINELTKKALGGDDIQVGDVPPEVSMKNVHADAEETGEEAKENA